MSHKEAGILGYIASKSSHDKLLQERIAKYYKNPVLCLHCNSVLPYNKRGSKFCNRSCAASFNNKKKRGPLSDKTKCKIRKTLIKNTNNTQKQCKKCLTNIICKKPQYCKFCGLEKGKCIDSYVCSKYRLFKSLEKFGFNSTYIGTIKVVDEFYRVKSILQEFYNTYSTNEYELKTQFGYTSGSANFIKLLKSLNIQILSSSDAVAKAWCSGKMHLNEYSVFKAEWHTSWDGKKFYLRSSYEKDYAIKLDNERIPYEVEKLRIKYYDSVKKKFRCAIPDFYLPISNTIVEVKSTYTLKNNITEMKDKFAEYNRLGYNTKLILNKKEVELNDISIENIDQF